MTRRLPALETAARILPVALIVLCARAWSLDEQETYAPPRVLVVTRAPEGEGSSRYQEMIARLVRITLADAGAAWIESAPGTGEAASGVGDPSVDLLESARRAGAHYLLRASCTTQPDGLRVDLSLYCAETGSVVSEVSRQGRIDLNLDRTISDAVDELLAGAADELARYRAKAESATERPGSALDPPPSIAGGGEGPRQAESGQPGPFPGSVTEIVSAPTIRGPSATPPRGSRSAGRFRHLEFTAGGAPFLPLGEASDYFKIGVASVLGGAYRFDLGPLVVGVGLEVGSSLFEASGASGSAQTILAPFGALVTCALSYGSPLEVALRLSGGGALLSMAPTGLEDRLSKLLPYASGGICLSLGFSPAFGLIVDTRFVTYFEQAYERMSPLFGVTPTVCVYVRV